MTDQFDRWRRDPLMRVLLQSIETWRMPSAGWPRDEQPNWLDYAQQLLRLDTAIKASRFADRPDDYLWSALQKGGLCLADFAEGRANLDSIVIAIDRLESIEARTPHKRGRPKGGIRLAEAKALIAQGEEKSRAQLMKSGLSGSTIDRARRELRDVAIVKNVG